MRIELSMVQLQSPEAVQCRPPEKVIAQRNDRCTELGEGEARQGPGKGIAQASGLAVKASLYFGRAA